MCVIYTILYIIVCYIYIHMYMVHFRNSKLKCLENCITGSKWFIGIVDLAS